MIRKNISKKTDIKQDSSDPVQHQSLGGNLHNAVGAARLHHSGKILLNQVGLWGRIGCGDPLLSDNRSVGADESRFLSHGLQDGPYHIAGGGFPLRSRYADGGQFFGRIAESGRRKLRQCLPPVFHEKNGHTFRNFHFTLRHKNPAAGFYHVRNEGVRIHGASPDADKNRIRRRLPGIINHLRYRFLQISL